MYLCNYNVYIYIYIYAYKQHIHVYNTNNDNNDNMIRGSPSTTMPPSGSGARKGSKWGQH